MAWQVVGQFLLAVLRGALVLIPAAMLDAFILEPLRVAVGQAW